MGRGGKRPGAGRPAGSLNKNTKEIQEAARAWGLLAVAKLANIMENSQNEQVQLAACRELLDRGYGKVSSSEVNDKANEKIVIEVSKTDSLL